MGPLAERVTGLSRRTREEIGKGNQMTALEIPDRRVTSDIHGLPSGAVQSKLTVQFKILF